MLAQLTTEADDGYQKNNTTSAQALREADNG